MITILSYGGLCQITNYILHLSTNHHEWTVVAHIITLQCCRHRWSKGRFPSVSPLRCRSRNFPGCRRLTGSPIPSRRCSRLCCSPANFASRPEKSETVRDCSLSGEVSTLSKRRWKQLTRRFNCVLAYLPFSHWFLSYLLAFHIWHTCGPQKYQMYMKNFFRYYMKCFRLQ